MRCFSVAVSHSASHTDEGGQQREWDRRMIIGRYTLLTRLMDAREAGILTPSLWSEIRYCDIGFNAIEILLDLSTTS